MQAPKVSKMEPRVAKNWVDKRDYSSDSYIADGLASRGIPSYVSHATILSCHYLAPLSPNSEIVIRDKDLQAAFRALRDDRFLDCRTKRACEEEFSKGSGPKPDVHLHYRGGIGRVDLYKHSTHFRFLREPVLGELESRDRNYMLLSDTRVPLLDRPNFQFAPLIETLPQFKDSLGPQCGRRVRFYGVKAPLLVRAISSWGYQFYQAVKSIYKLDKAIDNAKDNGIKRSYESKRADCIKDAWLWFVYLNAIVWLYRHNQDDPKRGHTLSWNQIMKEVDQELVPWLNNWKALYLVTDNRDKESHRAKFEKCIEDVTRALRPKRRK
ncbi:hypothetical protein ANOM_000069 [Aspergillus nomiae NRRL 13137]|uniref:Uncharacterized protein n=1 Tax=Aspergillus nomiae NRRL (strain ATCC 15546 / NRRL 13137 / CBS 260.88 / M93) TaxID=1509407 RepID=A0A0L1JJA5_ASPN3|nr:uncharacterized protein ANOM_000069 [Aspergillus nomiae NRRL 13137]KNG91463.1 hypothetical protein ANOM_000069 [Aspergillus nomiae NRRL 13137]